MNFRKYMHLERFGTTEVQNIELGETFVFPKLDGTNASVWLENGEVQAGSRKRHLSLEDDNAGFYAWVLEQKHIKDYLEDHPNHRLYGEFLVPHSLRTYRQDAWRKFYVFDVAVDRSEDDIQGERDNTVVYLSYDDYKPLLEIYGIEYIPPISIIRNGSYEQFVNQLAKNVFLIEDGKGAGEGIVIKNYDFKNRYGRTCFAKIVTSEFKEKHAKTMGASEVNGKKMIEEEIANKYVTSALCEKVYSKIETEGGFSGRSIPQLLNTVYYDVVREDCWNFVKEHKNPNLNFKTLQHFVFAKVKERLPQVF